LSYRPDPIRACKFFTQNVAIAKTSYSKIKYTWSKIQPADEFMSPNCGRETARGQSAAPTFCEVGVYSTQRAVNRHIDDVLPYCRSLFSPDFGKLSSCRYGFWSL